jgi:hypothetical protein
MLGVAFYQKLETCIIEDFQESTGLKSLQLGQEVWTNRREFGV